MGDTLLWWIVAVTFAWGLGCFMTWVLVRGGTLKKCREERREAVLSAFDDGMRVGYLEGMCHVARTGKGRDE